MKIIEVDEELYQYIASHTQSIGESASDILRRLLHLPSLNIRSVALDLSDKTENIDRSLSLQQETASIYSESTVNQQTIQPQEEIVTQQVQVVERAEPDTELDVSKQSDAADLMILLDTPEFKQESKAVVRFLTILSGLYKLNNDAFTQAIRSENVQGRTRVYFAQDEQTLLDAGNHTKPKQIPDCPHWVITNNNSGRKMIMLEGVMREMGFDEKTIDYVKNAFVADN
ncbi:replication initiation negative regulator SeqA [Lonepinella koalarum]|uniref:replication initiation negative regulator SeqA n=1 Tax=Lonepinella koalarum TaxID=53417 RepID=UPI0011E4798A|nr:replication initiation negative regulator SeqA [Lonepinella koalarum]TYG35454.1 replication initiation negative regulator SeqA [Lonepinella koalarum]